MKTRYLVPLFLLILVLGACGPRPEPTPQAATNTPPQPAPTETPLPPRQTSPLPEPERSPLPQPGVSPISPLPTPPEPPANASVTFLDDELGISPDEITVISFEPVDWPDTSLGCPQPGMMYAQVITPGYSFLLEAAGERYEVHTDLAGESVALCEPPAESLSDPASNPGRAFQSLLTHLTQAFPGFGLDQQTEWAHQDITKAAMEGISTWAWRSREWTIEMTFPAVLQPAYESVVFHQRAGTVWRGTLEADGQVTPLHESIALSFETKPCDETIPADTLYEWAGVDVTVQDGGVHIDQNIAYACCAELALSAGRDGDAIRVIETNVGQVCRCMCGYPVKATLTGMPAGTYTVEVWGVQHFDVHPLELLGSTDVTIA